MAHAAWQPMLASLEDAPLADPGLVYEPKYDGIRAIAEVTPAAGKTGPSVRLWSRLGNEKTNTYPGIVEALGAWAKRLKQPLVLDGEVVALDKTGAPTGFQTLQRSQGGPVAFIVFDLLRQEGIDLRGRPLMERRAALERLFEKLDPSKSKQRSSVIRLSEQARGDARALYSRALEQGWEGLIAKRADSRYVSGKRSPDWRKLKIVHEQEFVIGGWTEPRGARTHFGSLLVGVHDQSAGKKPTVAGVRSAGRRTKGSSSTLVYAGHVGTGFDARELVRLMKLLKPLETTDCPFREAPPSNERAHWVTPALVAQVKFTEWTADGVLRHPVYVALRDDKRPEDVVREKQLRLHATAERVHGLTSARVHGSRFKVQGAGTLNPERGTQNLVDQLRTLEDARRDGILELPDGETLKVTNLHKVFWPARKLTKGDLFRYYVTAASCVLPAVADRPLVMKRFPNGVTGQPFYQHRAEDAPSGVRIERLDTSDHRQQLVGGTLKTLLYMTQLAAISQDPWFSRVPTLPFADYAAIDLDPSPGVAFSKVLDVARAVHEELETLGAASVLKTSGARGLHIYIPLPPKTPYDAGLIFCQIVATVVSQKHPKIATVERSLSARGSRVYVDYLQNAQGKTLAAAYSARASEDAGVSTPLTWQEVDDGVRREDFTIVTVPARFKAVGDLWASLRQAKGADLSRVERYTKRSRTHGTAR